MKAKETGRRDLTPYLVIGLLAVMFAAWFPFASARFSDNEGTYTSISQELERGAKLYLDTWDDKPPLLYVQYLAVRRVLGTTPFALRWYVLFIHLANEFLLVLLLTRAGHARNTAWFAGFAYAVFVSSPNFQPYLAEADIIMMPLLLGAFCLAFSTKRMSWFFCGTLWTLAFFTKQSALFLLPAFVPAFEYRLSRLALWFFIGASLTSLAIFLPFLADGRLGLMLSAIFGIGHGMSGGYLRDGWVVFFAQDYTRENIFFGVMATALSVYSVALWLLAVYFVNKASDKNFKIFLSLWLGMGLLTCSLRGYFFTYYFFILIPPLAVGFALGLEVLKKTKLRLAPIGLAWLALFFCCNVWMAKVVNLDTHLGIYRNKDYARVEAQEAGNFLKTLARPGDKALIWSYEPEIYTYSGLGYSAIKSIWLYQLGKTPAELAQIEHAFMSEPPKFIVLHSYRENPPPPDWLAPFVNLTYERLPDVGGYLIYQRKQQ